VGNAHDDLISILMQKFINDSFCGKWEGLNGGDIRLRSLTNGQFQEVCVVLLSI